MSSYVHGDTAVKFMTTKHIPLNVGVNCDLNVRYRHSRGVYGKYIKYIHKKTVYDNFSSSAGTCARTHTHTHTELKNHLKNHLKTWLTSGSYFSMETDEGMQNMYGSMPTGSAPFGTPTSVSVFTVSASCSNNVNKKSKFQ